MSPADEPRTPHRVAVVVFATVSTDQAFDEREAARQVETAIRQALAGPRGGPMPCEVTFTFNGASYPVTVADVMDVGMAAGNGYLWTRPTGAAFRRLS